MGGAVDGNAVPHLILHHQHSDFLQLLAQLFDVIADNSIVDVHICPVIEHIEGACYIDFQRRGDVLCFFLVLLSQKMIQILQNGHILWTWVVQIVLIDQPHTAINDGFLHRLQSFLAAHNQLAQGQDKVRLEGQRAFIVRVVQIQVHRIDVVGGSGRNLNDLPMQTLHQRGIFCLRVQDFYLIGSQ